MDKLSIEMSRADFKIWLLLGFLIAWALTTTSLTIYFYQEYTNVNVKYSQLVSTIEKLGNDINRIESAISSITLSLDQLSSSIGQNISKLSQRISEISKVFTKVDIGINYGNGTIVWFNNTMIIAGTDAFKALLSVTDVNYTTGPSGVFVMGINGVNMNETCGWVFAVYKRCEPSWGLSTSVDNWIYPGVAADRVILKDDDIIVWLYYNWALKGWPPPPPV